MLRAGVTYGGRYAVRRKLSRGASSRTWLVEDLRDGRERVVRLQLNAALTPAEWARLDGPHRKASIDATISELEAAAAVWQVDSPYVAQIVRVEASAFVSDAFHPPAPVPALVLEYHRGAVPLDTLTATWEEVVLGVLARLAQGLAAMHRAHLAHGALCPDAVLVVADDEGAMRPLLVGFGPLSDGAGSLTGGPAAYAPPEADRGAEPDAAWDAWSMGVLICRALTGRLPFNAGAAPADSGARPRVLAREHVDLTMVEGDVREVIRACLSFEPGARPSMVGIGARLRRLLGEAALVPEESEDGPLDTLVDEVPRGVAAGPPPSAEAMDATAAMAAFTEGIEEGRARSPAGGSPEAPVAPVAPDAPAAGDDGVAPIDAFGLTMEAPAVTAAVLQQAIADARAQGGAGEAGSATLPARVTTRAPDAAASLAADPRAHTDREVAPPRSAVFPLHRAPQPRAVAPGSAVVLAGLALISLLALGWVGWSVLGPGDPPVAATDAGDPAAEGGEAETVYEDIDTVPNRTPPETIVIDTGLRTPLPPTSFGNVTERAPKEEDPVPRVEGEVEGFAWSIRAELPALDCSGRAHVVDKGGQRWLRLPCRIECKLDTDDADLPTALTACGDWKTIRAEPGPIPLGCAPGAEGETQTCLGEGAFRLTETGEVVKSMVKLELEASQ